MITVFVFRPRHSDETTRSGHTWVTSGDARFAVPRHRCSSIAQRSASVSHGVNHFTASGVGCTPSLRTRMPSTRFV